ncbi:MAG TPA: MarR family winged helix-turn-helix transcriptional regulator [Bacillota bacterium]|nr:MarR family winged helix-turn-helix transcriptional regulator [Bacillota bacterium]
MSDQTSDKGTEVRQLFRNVVRNFRKLIHQEMVSCDFTMPQVTLMQELYHTPGLTIKELGERMGLAKSTVSGAVDRLEAQGALYKVKDQEDRRIVHIYLTEKFLKIQGNLDVLKTNHVLRLLNRLEKEEVDAILNSLRKLNQLMETIPGHSDE